MKKSLIKIITVVLVFVMLSLPIGSSYSAVSDKEIVNAENNFDSQKVLESTFLNMLNHNYVYNDSFADLESIVNDSVIALLDLREENSSYIREDVVNGYLYDMFGFSVEDFSSLNPEFPQKEGYVFILPRGYSQYEHKALSIEINEDGTYTFVTEVKISSHDGADEVLKCETMFVENDDSVFGYNIVRSNITENVNQI